MFGRKWTFAEKLPRTIPVIQYSRIEEVDRIYDFLVGLNLKFNVVHGRILGQGPTPSLMEVCSKVQLKEDRTSAMNILTTFAIDCATSSVRFSTYYYSEKNNKKPVSICEHRKKQWHTKKLCWKLHGHPPRGKKHPPNDKKNTVQAYVSESARTSQPSSHTRNQKLS